tara:strand:+ start:3337 stop:3504 length:168 start_codon:yes stop_codon:yes gene_type:complete
MLYRNGLDPNVERTGLACCIDPRFDEAEKLVKYAVVNRPAILTLFRADRRAKLTP